jgi:hypothetical protein
MSNKFYRCTAKGCHCGARVIIRWKDGRLTPIHV